MLEIVEPDWEIVEEYKDGDHEILVEGVYESRDKVYAKVYQVVYKTPWRTLIGPTNRAPSSSEIHSALSLITDSPKYIHANIKANLLAGLFLRLKSMSQQKGFCLVCGRTGAGVSAEHDTCCVLYRALAIIQG